MWWYGANLYFLESWELAIFDRNIISAEDVELSFSDVKLKHTYIVQLEYDLKHTTKNGSEK